MRHHASIGDARLTHQTTTFSNGDTYSGTAPHSSGKYTWSAPSGATFRADFRSGRMSDSGTSGDTYRGSYGSKSYSNGDFYEGSWRGNLQDGHGRYVWRNGNQYVGEWRSGVISGRGVLVWANGNRYDGHWENGVPKGSGVFTWPDGSCYVGCWSKLTGTFYPATAPADSGRRRIHSAPSDDGTLSIDKNFSKICIWESDGEAGDITCDIVDTLQAYKERPSFEEERRRPCCFPAGEAKKPGQTISKGHKNYDLMLNLQLGIRYTVGKPASIEMRELRSGDFDPGEKFWTRFPPEGSKVTPPHQSAEFRWKDYCPMVFRHLRKLFAVDPGDYMMAICGNDALRELSSPGKSGSFFYLTQDDRFMIKTVKKSEAKVLIRMLPSYYRHVHKYMNSLVTKFFGVHCAKPIGGQKVRFVVIGNFFCSDYRINRRFDLKGSSYGRTTEKAEGEIDETTTLKDLDLNLVFRLQTFWFNELIKQIGRDCEFLEAEGIMDYSLLVGVHFCDDVSTSMRLSSSDLSRKPVVRLGSNLPARAEEVSRRGEACNVILYFGIIDVLQDYDISKKLEHAYKSLQVDPASISAVGPKLYARRFRDFIDSIFIEDD